MISMMYYVGQTMKQHENKEKIKAKQIKGNLLKTAKRKEIIFFFFFRSANYVTLTPSRSCMLITYFQDGWILHDSHVTHYR